MFMIENTKVPKTINKKKQLKQKFKNESTMFKSLNLRLIKQSLNQQGLQMVNKSHKSLECVFSFCLLAQFNQNKWFLITFMLNVLQKVKNQFFFYNIKKEDKSQIIYIYINLFQKFTNASKNEWLFRSFLANHIDMWIPNSKHLNVSSILT